MEHHTHTHTNLVVCVYLAKFTQILFLFDFVLGCFVFTVVFVVVVTVCFNGKHCSKSLEVLTKLNFESEVANRGINVLLSGDPS